MTVATGRAFWKMSGSGNDFVFLDARESRDPDPLENAADIAAICTPHLGIGADGVVFIAAAADARFAIRYYNADGSRASLCGNASLCAAQSAVRLGLAQRNETFDFMSDAGRITAAVSRQGVATVRLAPVKNLEFRASERLEPNESRIGFAVVGVPHLVILVDDVAGIDVAGRGRLLRFGAARAPEGANVNFVSAAAVPGQWKIRTYERGVEGETLACGTGAVAAAACLQAWTLAARNEPVELMTASDKPLTVSFPADASASYSSLSGEGRVVFEGTISALK